MPSYAEQIEANVQRLASEGAIPAGMEAEYVKLFTNNPKAQERFATVLSMDRDYTQKSQANAQWRREQDQQLAQERQRIQAEEQRLRQWETQANAEIQRLQAAQLTPETAARLAALETVVANYNLGEAVTVPPVAARTVVPPVQPTPQPQGAVVPDNSNYLSREEAAGALRDITGIYSQALSVSNEHFSLFGKPLTDDLVNESLNTGRSVREIYEAKYNPAGRRAELEQQNRVAAEAALRAKIEEEVRAQYATDPSKLGQGFLPTEPAQNQFFELAASRAQVDLTTGKPVAAAPEAIPDSQLQAARIRKATEFFNKSYSPDGRPRLPGGPAQGF